MKTKRQLILNITHGLDSLHACGVVHGDLKPENILMFRSDDGNIIAKIADFSHSVLDTGEEQYLPGGTRLYAAPESARKLSFDGLIQCDMYSYGLVVSTIAKGYDVVDRFLATQSPNMTPEDRMTLLDHSKRNGGLISFILELLFEADNLDIGFAEEEFIEIENLIRLTLSVDACERNLQGPLQWSQTEFSKDTYAKWKTLAISSPVVKHMNEKIVSRFDVVFSMWRQTNQCLCTAGYSIPCTRQDQCTSQETDCKRFAPIGQRLYE
jgi:serine/threonine protein kinase